jgi:hypothetical protein
LRNQSLLAERKSKTPEKLNDILREHYNNKSFKIDKLPPIGQLFERKEVFSRQRPVTKTSVDSPTRGKDQQ